MQTKKSQPTGPEKKRNKDERKEKANQQKMLTRIRIFLSPPIFPDDEKTRQARVLNTIFLGVMLILVLVGFVAVPFIFSEKLFNSITILLLFVIMGTAYWLMKLGRVRLASALLSFGMWAVFTIFIPFAGGIGSVVIVFYVAGTVFTGLLMGPWGALVQVVACGLVGLGMVILEASGHPLPRIFPVYPFVGWLDMMIALLMTMAIVNLVLRSLSDALSLTRQRLEERNRTETALRESEEKFRILFETSRDFLYITNMDGKIIDANKAATTMSGYSQEELRKINIQELYNDARERDKLIAKIVEQGFVENYMIQGRKKDGTVVDTLVNSTAIKDFNGNVIGFQGGIKDISELNRAEDALKESEKRFRALIENSTDAILMVDSDWIILYVSPSHERITGYRPEQRLGRSLFEKIHPDDCGILLQLMGGILDAPSQVNLPPIRARHADGSWRWLEAVASNLLAEPSVRSVVINFRDITERKQAEENIRRHTEELEILSRLSAAIRVAGTLTEIYPVLLQQVAELLKAEGTAIALLDASTGETIIKLGYGVWEDWTGLRLDTEKGISGLVISSGEPYLTDDVQHDPHAAYPDIFHEISDAVCVPLKTNRDTIGALWMGCKTPITKDDMHLLSAIGDMVANAIQRQVLYEDLKTQLKTVHETQTRLVQSEKLAAIGQLVAGVAHELNNPLTSVVLYSQMAQQENLDEKTKENLNKAVSEALRAGKIVHGLLDFARQRPLDRQSIQINNIVKDSLDLISYELHSRSIKVDLDLSPELPAIMADPHRLTQVFVNLIQNAWQAMSTSIKHGCIKISTDSGGSIYPAQAKDTRKVVRICFQDNGPGISEEIINRIFDPFFTTKPERSGTGLGLSICHGIIAEHGGHIWAESRAGEGASFFIELPIEKITKAKNIKRMKRTSPESSQEKMRILILDDEPNVRDVLTQALQRRGYTIDAVDNGKDGLAQMSTTDYNIILCDIRMPGFNGVDFYYQVRARYPNLEKKMVFITGDTASKATNKFIEEAKVKYLSKPFELSDLLQIIQLINDQ